MQSQPRPSTSPDKRRKPGPAPNEPSPFFTEPGVDYAKTVLAAIGSRKDDPEYIADLVAAAAEARRVADAEYLRELDATDEQAEAHR
jgi:hypothetical protein